MKPLMTWMVLALLLVCTAAVAADPAPQPTPQVQAIIAEMLSGSHWHYVNPAGCMYCSQKDAWSYVDRKTGEGWVWNKQTRDWQTYESWAKDRRKPTLPACPPMGYSERP